MIRFLRNLLDLPVRSSRLARELTTERARFRNSFSKAEKSTVSRCRASWRFPAPPASAICSPSASLCSAPELADMSHLRTMAHLRTCSISQGRGCTRTCRSASFCCISFASAALWGPPPACATLITYAPPGTTADSCTQQLDRPSRDLNGVNAPPQEPQAGLVRHELRVSAGALARAGQPGRSCLVLAASCSDMLVATQHPLPHRLFPASEAASETHAAASESPGGEGWR